MLYKLAGQQSITGYNVSNIVPQCFLLILIISSDESTKELLRNKLTNLYAGILFFNNSENQRIVNYLMLF
jgi:hypothetical protein